jgi:NitT/TauT family transport system substrate-binding protein
MKRRTVLKLLAAPAVVSIAGLAGAQARKKITYLYLLDPVYDAVLWAIRNGKVTSSLIDVEATGANIPALIQATATKQFDVVMSAVIAVPSAAARGLQLRILSAALYAAEAGEGGGIWVKHDSPLKTGADLKGKTLASYGLRSTGYMFQREALAAEFALNVAIEGGDFKQVEIVAPNLPAALATGQVDAASLIHSQAYRARQSGEFVNICETGKILNRIHGRLVASVNVSYPERLVERADEFIEFERMIKASAEYALANRGEVFPLVARQANIDPVFFDWWFDRTTEVPGTFTDAHARAVGIAWEIGKKFAMIPSVPAVEPFIWEHALRA